MTPKEFRTELAQRGPRPAYLFLGPDGYQRKICRNALLDAFLPPEERESGIARHHLDEIPLAAVLDDARSLSLFSPRRIIFAGNAEAALPKVVRKEADEAQQLLAGYLKDPAEGVVLVLESTRFGFDGDDKSKIERVQKYFAEVKAQVEFRPLDPRQAEALLGRLAAKQGVRMTPQAQQFLLEHAGLDASRIALEIEKLALFAGPGGEVTQETISAISPDSRSDTVFSLVNALAANDPLGALASLDLLVRQGEYLPLALAFVSTQFRLALAAREEGLRGRSQVMSYFSKLGIPMWPSRADQVITTAAAFTVPELRRGLTALASADLALRSARPDDRTVMEAFILQLAEAKDRPHRAG